ncbi:MAG: SIMPL domain-containing protein [Patescibacteria group bacterium]
MDLNSTNSWPRWIKTTLAAVVIIWLATLAFDRALQAGLNLNSLKHWQTPRPNTDTISISGQGKVTAIPDIGVVALSVESRGKTVAEIQADNTKKMNDIVAYLKSLDIEKKDIRTSQYNLSPIYIYEQNTGKQKLDGYQLTQTVEIKIRDLNKVGDALSGATDRGANQVGQLNFTIDDPEKLQAEARLKAIADARAKAEVLAKAAGIKLGKVRSFSENVNSPSPYPLYYARDMAVGGAELKSTPPQIEAGSQEVVVNVSLSFEIE